MSWNVAYRDKVNTGSRRSQSLRTHHMMLTPPYKLTKAGERIELANVLTYSIEIFVEIRY